MKKPNPKYFMHPDDQKALDTLKAIPGFDTLGKVFMKNFNEKQFRILNLSGRIRLSEEQMPEIYNYLPPICEKLGIKEPELYLELNRVPNAYTYGDSEVFIVLTTGLLEVIEEEDIPTVLAHECGHIACHHTLYRTMGQMLLLGIQIPGITQALQVAFSYWMRCSEFSADRASAYVMGGPDPIIRLMTRFAGAGKNLPYAVNTELFMKQAEEYRNYVGDSTWNKTLENIITMNQSHPLTAVRALTIKDWCDSDDFRILNGLPTKEPVMVECPNCHGLTNGNASYCKHCGAKLK